MLKLTTKFITQEKKAIFLVLLLAVIPQLQAKDNSGYQLADDPRTLKRVESFCVQEYRTEPSVITTCMKSQMLSIRQIEGYQMERYPNIDKNHPVSRILKNSIDKAGVVVNGKPWVNWSLAKLYFKKDMQTWLMAEGKEDPLLNYSL